jgi:hypothetical protein
MENFGLLVIPITMCYSFRFMTVSKAKLLKRLFMSQRMIAKHLWLIKLNLLWMIVYREYVPLAF